MKLKIKESRVLIFYHKNYKMLKSFWNAERPLNQSNDQGGSLTSLYGRRLGQPGVAVVERNPGVFYHYDVVDGGRHASPEDYGGHWLEGEFVSSFFFFFYYSVPPLVDA
jgi:hypothetical protein